MIKSFADKGTEALWNLKRPKKLPQDIHQRALNKLAIISQATDVTDLRVPPSNHLEALTGKRKGQFSIRINIQWRICFRFEEGDAYDVEITDYH